MAKRLELLYYDKVLSNWVNASYRFWNTSLTPDNWSNVASDQGTNINPITAVHLSNSAGNPRRAQVTLISRPRQIGSTTANEGKGRFNDVFTDFQNVRIRDPQNGTILLAGKIYDIDEKFDFRYGTSVILEIKDSLEELKGIKTGGWPDKAYTGNSTTRTAMIQDLITGNLDYVNSAIINTGGQNKETTSLRPQESNGKLEFKGNKAALSEITQLAAEEPHSKETREGFQIALVNEASDVNATVTEIDVDNLLLGYANAAAALTAGDHIAVDSEIMKVSSISTNAITVVRGVRGTTAATHANNAPVYRNPGAAKFGFDYHVDPAVVTGSISTAAPPNDWNYYQRGTRPDTPSTYGLTIKYPAASSFTADGFNKLMQNDFAFNAPNNEMFTEVILEYTEKGSRVDGAGNVNAGASGGASTPKRRKFERLDITGASGQLIVEGMVKLGRTHEAGTGSLANTTDPVTFTIDEYDVIGEANTGASSAADLLNNNDFIKVESEIMKVTARSGYTVTVARAQYGTSAVGHADNSIIYRNPFGDPDDWGGKPFGRTEIVSSSGGGAFGRIEYQSHTGGSSLDTLDQPGFIIVSPFANTNDADAMRFNAHMPEVYKTVTGSTSLNNVTTLANCRLSKIVGVKKTKVIKNTTSSDPASLRRQVTSVLSRDGQTGTKRGEFKVSGYPYTYIDAAAAKVSTSGNTVTFASAAFSDNNSGTTNDPRLFGVLVGDVICEMDATATTVTRYAYISSVTDTTVDYGGAATDTVEADGSLAGTALDQTKPMRIFVPLRAGHVIRVVNSLVQVDKDHLVTELTYDEGNGVTMTSISTIGQNDSAAVFRPSVLKDVYTNAVKYGDEPSESTVNFSDTNRAWKLQGKLTSADGDTVAWAHPDGGAFSLTSADGRYEYSIAAGNSGDMDFELDGTTPIEYVLYFAPETDDDAFAVAKAVDYIEDKSKLEIATLTPQLTPLQAVFSPEQNISTVSGGDAAIKSTPSNILSPSEAILADTSVASGSVPVGGGSSYGTFQYGLDGGGASVSTLGFLSGQTGATPAAATAQSAFWSMISESDGSGGSRLIFEPIVDYSGINNNAWIGWHNPLVGVQSYWFNAGNGTAGSPSFSFYSDVDTGMYRVSTNIAGMVAGNVPVAGFWGSRDVSDAIDGGGIYPLSNDVFDVGTASMRWDDIYATNTSIQTSDIRLKEKIAPTALGLDFINDLNPVSYKWKKKKENKMDQTHYGIIAQEVMETLKKYGINSVEDFGGITHEGGEAEYYGARYGEFIPILIKAVQELSDEVKELKEKK
tara:strand:- start:282 stop:4145 length:3864 start_codon:yes stop_codon:yes gene_type:complete